MPTNIRKGVFETNSSSMHSIAVRGGDARYENIPDVIHLDFDYWGWGYEELRGVSEKLAYVVCAIQYNGGGYGASVEEIKETDYYKWIEEMVSDYTGSKLQTTGNDLGSIDHQSSDMLDAHFVNDKEAFMQNIRDLVFNPSVVIIIDNDNH
jgi:hypothetical protein